MIKFERVKGFEDSDIPMPQRATECSAGYDFYAPEDIFIPAKGCSDNVSLNVKLKMSKRLFLKLEPRSGLAVKHGILLCTSGVIDSDYYGNPANDGNISVKFFNASDHHFMIHKGERCCQGIIQAYFATDDDMPREEERTGGFGSTGK